MNIRKAQASDIEQLLRLMSELGYEISSADLQTQIQTYSDAVDSELVVAAEGAGDVLGVIAGHLIPLIHQAGNIGRITALVVASEARGNGIGSALVAEIENWFKQNRCLRFEVTSGDHREVAHRFYQDRRYIQDERRLIKRNDA